MILDATKLLADEERILLEKRHSLVRQPGLALVWIGDDAPTATFVRVKQKRAKELDCAFWLHHFSQTEQRQVEALIESLNQNKLVHGIVIQLPLPANLDMPRLINRFDALKDIDDLQGAGRYTAPTAQGIVQLLQANRIDLQKVQTTILGAGKLVGQPLAEIFTKNNWPFVQINKDADKHTAQIKKCDVLISCTGVNNLVTKEMVHSEMIVVDGSGYDVDVDTIEPLVKAITPKKGAIGPLTVNNLFFNLFDAASS